MALRSTSHRDVIRTGLYRQMAELSLRLVAQQVPSHRGCILKLIAYADDHDFSRVEFGSFEELRKALLSVIPGLNSNVFSVAARVTLGSFSQLP